ncbi:MAG: hypothetical protein WC822_01625 [Candidatus Paceibacterota bacterium]
MNKELMQARQKFRNQKMKMSAGYDNTPLPEGKYNCEVVESKVRNKVVDDTTIPQHYMRLKIILGEQKGKSVFAFPNALNDDKGILGAARNIRAILGDVPGKMDAHGEFEVDVDQFLAKIEDELAPACIGEQVEITIKDSSKMRDDGTPWQNVFINRALGEDKHSDADQKAPKVEPRSPTGSMATGKRVAAKRR